MYNLTVPPIPLSQALVQNIINYLVTKPYQEVAPIIAEIQAQAMAVEKPTAEKAE